MSPDTQHTLVAYYGAKPSRLVELLNNCQQLLAEQCPGRFQPYALPQLHATLVGLEHVPGTRALNRNFKLLRGESRRMDISGYTQELESWPGWPVRIRFGGFLPQQSAFASLDRAPYHSSFGIYGDIPVITG